MSPASRRLQALVGAVRSHLRREVGMATAVWAGVAASAVLVTAWLAAGPGGWGQGSDLPLVLDALLLAVVSAAWRTVDVVARRRLGEAEVADSMEDAASLAPGTVRGSLELAREVPPGVSASLAGRAAQGTVDRLQRPASELTGPLGDEIRRWRRTGARALTAAAVLLVVLSVVAPERAWRSWSGLARPFALMVDPVLPPVEVEPGTVEVLRGSDVSVSVTAPGRATAELAWQAAGDVARSEALPLVEGRGGRIFQSVSAPIEYRVRTADGAESGPYRIEPVDPLFVSDLTVEVSYPAHTGLSPEEFRGDAPPLRLPVGSTLRFQGSASRPLSEAALLDGEGEPVLTLERDGARFQGRWRPSVEGTFPWRFLDQTGSAAVVQPDPLEVSLVADSAPRVDIPVPGTDTVLPLNLRQLLVVEARDDYGLSRMELVAYRVTAFGERREPVSQSLELGGARSALARPLLDLRDWELLPGDTVRYFARVTDNGPRGQTTTTREYVLRMPAADELRREAEDQLETTAERLQELAAEAERRARETRDMERQAAGERSAEEGMTGRPQPQGEEMEFSRQEELRNALEGQEELTGEVDSLRAELQALQETMMEAGQADPELKGDLEELQELLEQVVGDQMRERLEELSTSVDEKNLTEAQDALEKLAEEQEAFRDRLEESLERFRRAAVEQDFRATESEAQDLARQEQALADAMEENDDPELRARQQDELRERAGELESRMESLQERLEALEENDAARGVEDARRDAARSEERMSEAGRQAQAGQPQEAGREAQEAADAMQEAAQQLKQAQQQMAQQKAEAAQRALRQTADDALSLARRQASLQQEMEGADPQRLASMRADEAALLQGIRNMAANLQAGSQGALAGNRELAAQMGRALESVQRTVDAMENRRGPTPAPTAAERAVDDLNQVALRALAGAQQMSQQGQGQSGQQVTEQLEELAQQQGDLFNQTGQLMPLQLGEQAMAQQLQQLSQQQQSVAGELGEMSQDPEAEERSLGDLQALAEEARALAQQLAGGRLSPETVQRQERLFHRLLDAGRSLEREEFSNERESEVAGAFERSPVLSLGDQELGALRYQLPEAGDLQRLPPAVRQLVIQYFERLNADRPAERRGGGPGGGGEP